VPASATTPVPSANPLNEEMVLVFADEFDGDRLNDAVWTSQACKKDLKRDTARGPGNLEVRDGELRLHVRRERIPVGNRVTQWTAGYVYTRGTRRSPGEAGLFQLRDRERARCEAQV